MANIYSEISSVLTAYDQGKTPDLSLKRRQLLLDHIEQTLAVQLQKNMALGGDELSRKVFSQNEAEVKNAKGPGR